MHLLEAHPSSPDLTFEDAVGARRNVQHLEDVDLVVLFH